MTDSDRIAEIEARANAATQGPWTWDVDDASMISLLHDRTEELEHPDVILWCNRCPACVKHHTPDNDHLCGWPNDTNDKFIAHSREDIPYLIDRLRAVERERDELLAYKRGVESAIESGLIKLPEVGIANALKKAKQA